MMTEMVLGIPYIDLSSQGKLLRLMICDDNFFHDQKLIMQG